MKIIKIPVYKTEVGFFFEKNTAKAVKIIKKRTGNKEVVLDDYDAQMLSQTGEACFIWFRHRDASTIAHEAIHAAWFVLKEAGVKIDHDNHEALTYLAGYLVRNIVKGI